jgi:superfamily I DNA/RNA helicase
MDKVIGLALTLNGRVNSAYAAGRYTVRQLADLLEKWESGQVAAYREAGKLWKVAKVEDICGGIRVLLRQMPLTATVQDVQARIKSMFTNEEGGKADRVVLCSGHKSKGLEWYTVIWYGENLYQPSKYAKSAEDVQQEKNLCYVMATRAQKRLVRLNAEKEGK